MQTLVNRIESALATRFGERVEVPADTAGLGTLATLAEHRTCRRYLEHAVPDDLLRLVIASAFNAPSKSDLMQVDIVTVEDVALRDEIADLIPTMEWIRTAPCFLVICGNGRRLPALCERHGVAFGNDHLDAFFNPAVDAGLVLAFLLMAAEAVGLGTCPISVVRDHSVEVSRLLALPERVFPVCGLTLGWPAERPDGVRARLPLSLTLHRDRYRETDFAHGIDEYDARRGRLDGFDPASSGFRGWSRAKAEMYEVPQREDFGEFIRAKGFDLR